MKGWLAATALAALTACIENPGTDQGLATKHDRLEDDFPIGSYAQLHIKVERSGDESRLSVTNPGPRMIDSVEFLLQVLGSPLQSWAGLPDMSTPALSSDPLAEFHGKVVGIGSGMTLDLGPLALFYPWGDLDKLTLNFIPFNGSIAGRDFGSKGLGYFTGRISSADTALHFPGGLMRAVATEFNFFSWVGEGENGMLTGFKTHDTLWALTYLHYWNSSQMAAVDLGKLGEGDSLSFQAEFLDRQTPPESALMDITLARPSVRRFPGLQQ
jgi:hypothetical protein